MDFSEAAIARLSAGELVAALGEARPDDPALKQLDIDVVAQRIDPRRLSKGEFVGLLTQIGRLADAGADVDQTCTVSHDVPEDAKTTITVGPAELLRLATGNASPTFLFLRGKVKISGSLGFAQAFMNLFELPKA
ncbi:MAG: SCP2 sterol-binding domain-containing protein [Micromonosporaceae bacterium]